MYSRTNLNHLNINLLPRRRPLQLARIALEQNNKNEFFDIMSIVRHVIVEFLCHVTKAILQFILSCMNFHI